MPAKQIYEFGEFRIDAEERLLLREGKPIPMTPKAFETLLALVENSGHVVKKDDLMKRVWPDAFVEEVNLAQNVSAIRRALNGQGEQYIETVPKLGYRLIVKARVMGEPVGSSETVLRSVTAHGRQPAPPLVASEKKRSSWKFVAAPLALMMAAIGLVFYLRQAPKRGDKAPILLAAFVNRTGDAVFDGTLREGLSVQLEQSPFLSFISDEQVRDTLRLMGRPAAIEMSPDVAREVCLRTNATVTFSGSIDLIGTRYALTLRAIECSTGSVLASTAASAADKSRVLDAVSKLASDIRAKLGEPLNSVRQYNVPLASVTTPSLEALRCYTEGIQSLSKDFDYTESLSWFQRAIELDPGFATAYWAIGDVYAILGETHAAVEYTRKAFELRQRVSIREKGLIEANYFYYVLGDVEKARHSCEFLAKLYPFSADTHNSLAVFAESIGRYDVGLMEYLEALRLSPRSSYLYRDVAYTYLALDRIDDALGTVQKAHSMDLDANLATVIYSIAFYRNDRGEMARQVADAAASPETENLLLAMDADTAAYGGKLRMARALSRRASESAERTGRKETAALYDAVSALRESMFGNSPQQQGGGVRRGAAGRDLAYAVALSQLSAGDLKRGQVSTDELGKRFANDSVVNCNYLPTLRAKLALLRSNPQQAIDDLTQTTTCELGLPVYSYYNWPNLYPAYVRGEAYLAAHRGPEAVAEFNKILSHRGLVLNEPIGVLSYLQLGRSYMLTGDTTKARTAYREFLALWKDADSDIRIYRQAKTEYANLSKLH